MHNRLKNISLMSDKDMDKKGRGTYQELRATIDEISVRVLKWFYNKAVTLVTSIASATPIQECKRFDKKKTMIHNIPMPDIVFIYNKLMVGVDCRFC